jgi:hypothetical protein
MSSSSVICRPKTNTVQRAFSDAFSPGSFRDAARDTIYILHLNTVFNFRPTGQQQPDVASNNDRSEGNGLQRFDTIYGGNGKSSGLPRGMPLITRM